MGRGCLGCCCSGNVWQPAFSQDDLAVRSGLSRRGISDLERGTRRSPHSDTVRRLAQALGLSEQESVALRKASLRPDPTVAAPEYDASEPPVKWTTFVGRQSELAEIGIRLAHARLLSLVGPGGIGKTRLALEVAQRYADGVVFVDLAPLGSPDLVVQGAARALGLRIEVDHTSVLAVVSFLRARQVLLVLDNCEHLVHAPTWSRRCVSGRRA